MKFKYEDEDVTPDEPQDDEPTPEDAPEDTGGDAPAESLPAANG